MMKTVPIHSEIERDEFIIIPNHLHGVIVIVDDLPDNDDPHGLGDPQVVQKFESSETVGRGDRPVAPTNIRPTGPKPRSVGAIMAGFKSAVTKRINELRGTPGAAV